MLSFEREYLRLLAFMPRLAYSSCKQLICVYNHSCIVVLSAFFLRMYVDETDVIVIFVLFRVLMIQLLLLNRNK